MIDGQDLSPAVAAAHEAIDQGLTLSDPGVTETILRPWLESVAVSRVGDATMAALVAQQVLIDLGMRVAADFPSATSLQQWLEVRVTQTVGLFTGMMAPPLVEAPAATSSRQWRWGLLGIPLLGHLPKFGTLPWLVGGAASTALATGLAAITLTATFPTGLANVAPRSYPAQLPPPPTAQLLLPSPSAARVSSPAPKVSTLPRAVATSPVVPSTTEPVSRKTASPTVVVTPSPKPPAPKPTPVPTKSPSPPPPTPPPTPPPSPSPPPHRHCHPPACWQHRAAGVQPRGPNCCPGPPFGVPQAGDPDDRGQAPCSQQSGHPGPWGHKPWLGQSDQPPAEPAKH